MVYTRILGSLSAEEAQIQPASPQNVELIDAVSDAASQAATKVVMRGLVGYAAITVTGMAARKLGFGFLTGVALISGVGFVAAKSLKR